METVSIILPVVDELENLKIIIPYFVKSLKDQPFEIIVIEDQVSSSKTREYVSGIKSATYVKGEDKGLTSAIKRAIGHSKGQLVYWSDADLSHPPEMVHEMLVQIRNNYDVVVCSRFEKGSRDYTHEGSSFIFIHKLLSKILSRLGQLLLCPGFKDYSSGFILVKREVLESVRFTGDYGEYFMELIYNAFKADYRIIELPFISPKRVHGHSKTATNLVQLISRGYKYLLKILEIRFLRS